MGSSASAAAPALPGKATCLAAWNTGATHAQKASVRKAIRVMVGSVAVGGRCTVTFVLRGGGVRVATGSVVAAPGGSSGVWRLANAPMALGPSCKGNAGMGAHGDLFSLL
jgi:hypothetical protein